MGGGVALVLDEMEPVSEGITTEKAPLRWPDSLQDQLEPCLGLRDNFLWFVGGNFLKSDDAVVLAFYHSSYDLLNQIITYL